MQSSAALALPSGRYSIEPAASFKAPLLDRILDHGEDPGPRIVALDLGPPCQALIDRIGQNRSSCRIEIADLFANRGLQILDDPEAIEEHGPALLDELLPRPNAEPVGLVLCWDLPNYLSLAALKLLCSVLGQRAAPDCKLHMLVTYSKREMAAEPARYVPGSESGLTQTCTNIATTAAPRYSPEDIGRAVGRFEYERGVLLANGMQEFVYAWPKKPGADGPVLIS